LISNLPWRERNEETALSAVRACFRHVRDRLRIRSRQRRDADAGREEREGGEEGGEEACEEVEEGGEEACEEVEEGGEAGKGEKGGNAGESTRGSAHGEEVTGYRQNAPTSQELFRRVGRGTQSSCPFYLSRAWLVEFLQESSNSPGVGTDVASPHAGNRADIQAAPVT